MSSIWMLLRSISSVRTHWMPNRPCRHAFQFVVTGDQQIPAHTLRWRTRLSHIVSYCRYGMSVNLSICLCERGGHSCDLAPSRWFAQALKGVLFLIQDLVEFSSQGPLLARSSPFDLQGPNFHTYSRSPPFTLKISRSFLPCQDSTPAHFQPRRSTATSPTAWSVLIRQCNTPFFLKAHPDQLPSTWFAQHLKIPYRGVHIRSDDHPMINADPTAACLIGRVIFPRIQMSSVRLEIFHIVSSTLG